LEDGFYYSLSCEGYFSVPFLEELASELGFERCNYCKAKTINRVRSGCTKAESISISTLAIASNFSDKT
jgi:hypothetical protein